MKISIHFKHSLKFSGGKHICIGRHAPNCTGKSMLALNLLFYCRNSIALNCNEWLFHVSP